MRLLLAFVASLLVASFACAQTAAPPRVVETQASARGPTPEAAVRAALGEALRAVNGSAVAFDQRRKKRFEDAARDLDAALAAEGMNVERMQAEVATLSRGLVERLRVLETRSIPDGTFEASIVARVAIFDDRLATRKTVAVTLFRAGRNEFRFGATDLPAPELVRRLADLATERLVQSNTVTVLDRSFVDEIGRERNFLELHSRSSDELARFGRMLGADYLLVGSVEFAGLEVINRVVEASGYSFTQASAGIEVSARLVDVASGAIAWADTIRASFGHGDLQRLFPGATPDPGGTAGALVTKVADRLAEAVVESVAPIKVALVEGDVLWVNRGSGRLAVGQRLLIRGGGQDVIDPDTGESLGSAERTIAVVEVVATDPRKSQCRVMEGDPSLVRVGHVARPVARP
jgi:curli biogenesis system outer membrane secretion channel CsgG